MGLTEGHVAYVHKFRNAAIQVKAPKRTWRGPNEVYDPGFTAQFIGFLFTTDDPEMIDAMDHHVKYGLSFQRVATAADYDLIRKHGQPPIRFSRGPATTLAERLGAPKFAAPDDTPIEEIAPPPEEEEGDEAPVARARGRRR